SRPGADSRWQAGPAARNRGYRIVAATLSRGLYAASLPRAELRGDCTAHGCEHQYGGEAYRGGDGSGDARVDGFRGADAMSEVQGSSRLEQAACWFAARRRGVMAVEELTRYEIWASDPDNLSAMVCLERAWDAALAARTHIPETARQSEPARRSRLA